ncbi:DUF1223 domain-containing protein [Pontibacter sp. G13]|uniref:DUF1223 domain-containing protein n=1 Tax=Pontibacter sp. G13 TaxID=3074898 RepID=UPI00288A945C|nr:DUF1223 domain-containing protein [Pontibacter sp. G13]WNJ17968.1 DUF1223 domain-containing protein [Pontibacter sp. G13]
MKLTKFLFLPIWLLTVASSASAQIYANGGPATLSDLNPGIAVVELFTSEGCSSCPAADRLLEAIFEDARNKGLRIFPLSYHVDYWDHLGWKDPYGDKAFSNRQRAYAMHFRDHRVYTPQMVVNGQEGFVGSDRGQATTKIRQAIQNPAQVEVELTAEASDESVEVQFQLSEPKPGKLMMVAIVEDGIEHTVTKGENSGRKLKHVHVVRALEAYPLGDQTTGSVHIPWREDKQGPLAVIAFIQDGESFEMYGAATTTWE